MVRFLDTFVLAALILVSSSSFADGRPGGFLFETFRNGPQRPQDTPLSRGIVCEGRGGVALQPINEQVIQWQKAGQIKFQARALVKGTLVQVFPDRSGHDHFLIQIGKTLLETLEVVYNSEFGSLPQMRSGEEVEACGDYITTARHPKALNDIRQELDEPSYDRGSYTTSIIHWVHLSDHPEQHDNGYIKIQNTYYGTQIPNDRR